MRRTLVASLMFAVTAAGTVGARAQEVDADSLPVKRAIADRMTPEELHAYKLELARAIKEGRIQRNVRPQFNPLTPADTCTAATYELTSLPFNSADTTVGMTDDYDLPPDITLPTCTASTNCTNPDALAGCGPRGCVYAGTGTAPDRAYRIRVSAPCDLTITGTPTAPPPDDWDLSLLVYQTQCSSSLADCVCVDDEGFQGMAESVILNAVTGLDYFIVIDGYLEGGMNPPPNLGPFDLSVTGTGCVLVPVELLDFEIS
jgi:hypothetical protein